MVFANLEAGLERFSHHPIHMHGHGFAVLKVGYPEYDTTTGKWTSPSDDLVCTEEYEELIGLVDSIVPCTVLYRWYPVPSSVE